ncbi:long-chain fatty acid--CoA ligase [Pontibacillus litoralis]|uniref:Long-chain fatty acid--CoA ligase n=1 Tax=Pontibacillus litoralis JSM 072002 TaxID=1385512 RepID=A0A0A5FZT7_9BACI|nr:long-chain fatty acid--CoA ligase [Pontibacillus litoralis]KGX85309.1 long-chain fatty acid--CoA ligase [Pontibacillus litoralis JSM 072002]
MMNTPLLLPMMMERAEKFFPKKEVISRTLDGIHRVNYKELGKRTRKLSHALKKLGVQEGERVGTLAWNHHRHLEAYFAIPGIGAVLHTINIRLSPQHVSYIVNHAEDKVLLIDEDILPLVEAVQTNLNTVEAYVIMTDKDELPETTLSPVYHYESLLKDADPTYEFKKDLDEHAPAGMCYTSATTGNPKGVVYSHRSIVLHSMALGLADMGGVREADVAMPVVPMFHVNAWGLPFLSVWFGTTQVMPGPQFTPKALAELIDTQKVTITAGVPTIWLGLLRELDTGQYDTSSLRAVLSGGSASPKSVIQEFELKYNIPCIPAYGMTETTPLAAMSTLKSYQMDLPEEEILNIRAKQGVLAPGLEMKVMGKNGEVAWDGKEMGELLLRGPWIADEYYKDERTQQAFQDGWLYTGDVVTVDEEGAIKIVDRTKDLVKSGGEWISSVDLENTLMAHEAVYEAAVIAIPHEKWQERPLACVVCHEGKTVSKEELYDFLALQFAKWWLPDEIVFMEEIPKTSVGKFLKRALRDSLNEHFASSKE